ncbi:cell wall metabolism sensor histidine kinase WalK [Cellulomonas sp. URHD0024]|uniref:sensor histidine kinase n=1 Tax=Cellulomonas sp. URHD0024 TaxID=1302620 RepID=UPI0004189055|nr:ATP-binding protein [Cellulomonas sp. URHD0024]
MSEQTLAEPAAEPPWDGVERRFSKDRRMGTARAGTGRRSTDLGNKSPWVQTVHRLLGPDASALERQLPFLVLYLVAMLIVLTPWIDVPHPGYLVVAGVLVIAQALAARLLPWGRWPEGVQDILPMVLIAAVGVVRTGTGVSGPLFTTIVFLPVINLAAQRGRRGVVLGTVGVAAVVFAPTILDSSVHVTADVVVRSLYLSLVTLVVAVTVHEITDRLRARTIALERLQKQQADLLERARLDAVELGRVADARRATRNQLISVIDSATEQAIIATDAEGVIEVFNPGAERLLGYSQGEVVGRLRLPAFHVQAELDERSRELVDGDGDGGRTLYDTLFAAALAGRPEVRDWTYVRRDGTTLTVRLAVTRREEVDGFIAGYVVVATDVTAEREAARLQDEFVSLVSHELRTPLTSVLGYLELLTDGTDPLTDEQREYLTVIDRNARRQLRLVGDLLLSAQVDAGRFAISTQQVDLADVVRASVASAVPAAEGARVAIDAAVEPSVVDADPVRLAQALDNLVSNAIKFTPAGGAVRVSVEPTVGGARLAVADSGIGIPPDELESLTTRFFRASTATRRAIPGIGLGLSITKAVVDAHGGTLSISSVVGEGTSFTIDLPATPPA